MLFDHLTRNNLYSLALPLLFALACQNTTGPQLDPAETQIHFIAAGGITGGTWYKLSITTDGLAINEIVEPHLQQQLTRDEHEEILAMFDDFLSLQNRYDEPRCADDVAYEITLTNEDRSKTVTAWGCAHRENAVRYAELAQIKRIIDILTRLADRIYEQEAPWLGLRASFSLDKNTYGLGEPITLNYTIKNPTNKMRSLYFPFAQRFGFEVSKKALPGFHHFYPGQQREKADLTQIDFQPGEEKTLIYHWDQEVVGGKGNRSMLTVGRYFLTPYFLDSGNLRIDTVAVFDVVDKSIPLAGFIEPDYNGDDRSSSDYTFKLAVRNWTDTAIALHFPYDQKIAIRLYYLGLPAAVDPPLLFEWPKEPDAAPSTLILQPGEQTTLIQPIPKRDLNLADYEWYLVEIRLLLESFEFIRDGHVRISK